MKKLIIGIVAVCVLFVGLLGYIGYDRQEVSAPAAGKTTETGTAVQPSGESAPDQQAQDTEITAAQTEPAEESATLRKLDFDSIYALHDGSDVVMTINGKDITWDEYFYWLYSSGSSFETTMEMYGAYGYGITWDTEADETGATYLDYLLKNVESNLKQFYTIETTAEELGVTLSEEALAEIEEQKKADAIATCGEGATVEDLCAALAEQHMTAEYYDRFLRVNYLYDGAFNALFGENCELVTDEDAIAYLEEQGYIAANHILLPTKNLSTSEALSDEEIEKNRQLAEELSAELQTIEGTEERIARFAELKAAHDADGGKVNFPDGYTFTSGTMVEEFESACLGLQEYEISAPVESTFGYHVIMRMPLDADRTVDYAEDGTAMTGRRLFANASYSEKLQSKFDAAEIVYRDEITGEDLKNHLG